MKFDEMSDISSILVEANDERAEVVRQVGLQRKPVVIVVPEWASHVFHHPGHFVELRQLKRQRGISITLVLMGNEQIRNYARRQGFAVYASQETCARALARRDRFRANNTLRLVENSQSAGGNEETHVLAAERTVQPTHLTRYAQYDLAWYNTSAALATDSLNTQVAPLATLATEPLTAPTWAPVRGMDKFMLVLITLLLLGILGGVGFGYLLTMVS